MERDVVRQAKEALQAEGKHPSADAVLTYIGHGSKRDAHRILRELAAEEAGAGNGTTAVETLEGTEAPTLQEHLREAQALYETTQERLTFLEGQASLSEAEEHELLLLPGRLARLAPQVAQLQAAVQQERAQVAQDAYAARYRTLCAEKRAAYADLQAALAPVQAALLRLWAAHTALYLHARTQPGAVSMPDAYQLQVVVAIDLSLPLRGAVSMPDAYQLQGRLVRAAPVLDGWLTREGTPTDIAAAVARFIDQDLAR
jgi:hypothetical protein